MQLSVLPCLEYENELFNMAGSEPYGKVRNTDAWQMNNDHYQERDRYRDTGTGDDFDYGYGVQDKGCEEYAEDFYSLQVIEGEEEVPMIVEVEMNGAPVTMQVDTGTGNSLVSKATYDKVLKGRGMTVRNTSKVLKTYTGELIRDLKEVWVDVACQGQRNMLPLLVLPGQGPSLMGRDWLRLMGLGWEEVLQGRPITGRDRDWEEELWM